MNTRFTNVFYANRNLYIRFVSSLNQNLRPQLLYTHFILKSELTSGRVGETQIKLESKLMFEVLITALWDASLWKFYLYLRYQ